MQYPCEILTFPTRPTLSVHFRSPVEDLPQHFAVAYTTLGTYLESIGESFDAVPYAAYHNMDMKNLDVEAGLPVARALPGNDEVIAGTIPGGKFAVCHYAGPYSGLPAAFEALMTFMNEHGYTMTGPSYEWYLDDPATTPVEKLRTDAAVPVVRVSEAAVP
jgi:effector-binding domain-containing protein